jgi:hypothetical protein
MIPYAGDGYGSIANSLWQRFATGVPREFGERSKRNENKFKNKKSPKSIINIIFKNNSDKVLTVEVLNTILLLVFES